MSDKTITLPRQVRTAEMRGDSFDESAYTVDIIWTTGATVRRVNWRDGEYDEELEVTPQSVRLHRLNAGAPFLDTHDSYGLSSVIGSVVPGTATIVAGRGLATIKLSRAAGDADTVAKIRDGIIRNISVGYLVHRATKEEADDGSIPKMRVTDWEPLEISAVPIPADPGAQMRSASKGEAFPCVVSDTAFNRKSFAPSVRARLRMAARQAGLV